MATGDISEQENGFRVDLLKIEVVKGNELTDLITETFDGSDFAKNEYDSCRLDGTAAGAHVVSTKKHGGVTGWEAGKEVRVSKQIAVLGARGDYVNFILDGDVIGTYPTSGVIGHFKVQALDYSGVPVAVQHSIFGKYSPFLTPTQPVSRGMIRGVDRQEIELVHNVKLADAAAATAVNQKIRGTATAKWTGVGDEAAMADLTKLTYKAAPGSDQVYVIPRGAKIWVGNSSIATKTYTGAA
jgi:hypothetical protein